MESLKGSGLIAGETSRAYDDIFTITLVTARSVCIGAHLVRLGERPVQVEGQPIIFTGAPALNKVLGRKIYTSNLQLGSTQIMFKNGVSHLSASSDLEGATHILESLASIDLKTEHREAATRLEQLDITKTAAQLKAEFLVQDLLQMVNQSRKAIIDCLACLLDNLTNEEKATLQSVLRTRAKCHARSGMYSIRNLSVGTYQT